MEEGENESRRGEKERERQIVRGREGRRDARNKEKGRGGGSGREKEGVKGRGGRDAERTPGNMVEVPRL
eukprot:4982918-Pleurochrysis_carterae.AAC.1